MTTYSVTLSVTTELHIGDEQARDVAATWAADLGFELGMTSTSRDRPWLRVSAVATLPELTGRIYAISDALDAALHEQGTVVAEWEAIEIVTVDEQVRRGQNRAIPPMVNAGELADLAGITVQRVYQYESDRKGGKDNGFPAPVLDGYWLRTVGEHWAATRKRKPGPAARPK